MDTTAEVLRQMDEAMVKLQADKEAKLRPLFRALGEAYNGLAETAHLVPESVLDRYVETQIQINRVMVLHDTEQIRQHAQARVIAVAHAIEFVHRFATCSSAADLLKHQREAQEWWRTYEELKQEWELENSKLHAIFGTG